MGHAIAALRAFKRSLFATVGAKRADILAPKTTHARRPWVRHPENPVPIGGGVENPLVMKAR